MGSREAERPEVPVEASFGMHLVVIPGFIPGIHRAANTQPLGVRGWLDTGDEPRYDKLIGLRFA